MCEISLRQKKVASLIKVEMSRYLLEFSQNEKTGIISITTIEMTKDLKAAHIYLSFFNCSNPDDILSQLSQKEGQFRKNIASNLKLKYNPKLIFSLDPMISFSEKMKKILSDDKEKKDRTQNTTPKEE